MDELHKRRDLFRRRQDVGPVFEETLGRSFGSETLTAGGLGHVDARTMPCSDFFDGEEVLSLIYRVRDTYTCIFFFLGETCKFPRLTPHMKVSQE